MSESADRPKWLRDVHQLLPIRSQFVLTGAIRDKVLLRRAEGDALVSLHAAIWSALQDDGYSGLLIWDLIGGLREHTGDPQRRRAMNEVVAVAGVDLAKEQPQPMRFENLGKVLQHVNGQGGAQPTAPVALIVDYASRLRDAGRTSNEVHDFFMTAEQAAISARPVVRGADQHGTPLFNPVFWLVNRANDLPYWLTVDNERVRSIAIPLPDLDTRRRAATALWHRVKRRDPGGAEAFAKELASLTDNLSLTALEDIVSLTNRLEKPASEVDEAVRSHRVGDLTKESPWRGTLLKENIRRSESPLDDGKDAQSELSIANRVLGQPKAVVKVLDILKRTSIGLTGAHAGASPGRPRGVLFFVGPTGVGKTEMAKAIAKIVFGDDNALKRFDMSEFSAEHSGDRLIGAPPGYTGFDQGGELTNAMRERPFRVLLFDEIEKAHHRILDKFLQVLEDGRLTDGRGETVYFSESLIVFTSNLGVSRERPDGSVEVLVSPDDSPEEFETGLLEGVHDFFKRKLQRPELLNRIGENIVIFHYITPEVGQQILDKMIRKVCERVHEEHKVGLELAATARQQLGELCVGEQVDNGGRGIGSKVEAVFTNPLARLMFDRSVSSGLQPGDTILINEIVKNASGYELRTT